MSLWISFFECIINYLLISLTTETKCKSVLITSTLRGFRGSYNYCYRSVAGDGSDCKPYPPCPQNTIRNIFNIQRWRAEGILFFPSPEGVCSLGGGGRDSIPLHPGWGWDGVLVLPFRDKKCCGAS